MFREGQQIGQYTLTGKLGKGGFGEVWLAEKRSQFIVKRVAVKLPLDEQVNFDAIRQEAQLWEAASGHPNVLPIIDADVYDGQVCIVSEYASGGSLHDRLKRETKLSTKEAVEMTIGILNGLEFLHGRKIIHRDIKPHNILLQGNTPRLADFGISRAMNTTIISSAIIGTDAYMSPEAFDGKRSIQTDIWSVGVVLYQMLKGSLPFPQEHPTERMFAVLTKDFEPLADEIPTDLRRIIDKSLAKLPENRYGTTTEMRDELLKAHVPLAHPTLARTEVLRFPVEPKTFDETVAIVDEKETTDKNPPNIADNLPIYAPAPTQPAVESDSIITNFKPTPFVEAKPEAVQPETKTVERSTQRTQSKLSAIAIVTVIGGFALFIGLIAYLESNYRTGINVFSFQDTSGKFGLKDKNDKIYIPAKYEVLGGCVEDKDLCYAKLNGKYGFIDADDKVIITFKFDDATFFSEDLAAVKINDKWGYIDKNDKTIIPFRFGYAGAFILGSATACLNSIDTDSCGTIDKTGKEIASFKYDFIYGFREGLAAVRKNGKWGFINYNEVLVIPYKYDSGAYFNNGYAEVELGGRKVRIDKNGNETDSGATSDTNNPNVSTYNTPTSNSMH